MVCWLWVQMQQRRTLSKLPLQANFYPMSSASFLQDSASRMSLLSAQSQAVASLRPGGCLPPCAAVSLTPGLTHCTHTQWWHRWSSAGVHSEDVRGDMGRPLLHQLDVSRGRSSSRTMHLSVSLLNLPSYSETTHWQSEDGTTHPNIDLSPGQVSWRWCWTGGCSRTITAASVRASQTTSWQRVSTICCWRTGGAGLRWGGGATSLSVFKVGLLRDDVIKWMWPDEQQKRFFFFCFSLFFWTGSGRSFGWTPVSARSPELSLS